MGRERGVQPGREVAGGGRAGRGGATCGTPRPGWDARALEGHKAGGRGPGPGVQPERDGAAGRQRGRDGEGVGRDVDSGR